MEEAIFIQKMRAQNGKMFARLPLNHPPRKRDFTRNLNTNVGFTTEIDQTLLTKDYVEHLLSMLHFFCLVPFKFSRTESGLHLEKCIPQQVVCAVIHAAALFYQFVEVLYELKEDVDKKPQTIFTICFDTIDMLYLAWATKCIWCEQEKFLKLVEQLTHVRSTLLGASKYYKLKCIAICVVPFIATAIDILKFLLMEEDGPMWNHFSTSTNALKDLPIFASLENQSNWIQRLTEILYFLSNLANMFLYNCLDSFLLSLCVAGYETTCKFLQNASETRFRTNTRLSLDTLMLKPNYLIEDTMRLKIYFATINEAASGFFLFWFCSFCPWAALHLMESLPGVKDGKLTSYNWFYIFYYGIFMVFSVKAKKKV